MKSAEKSVIDLIQEYKHKVQQVNLKKCIEKIELFNIAVILTTFTLCMTAIIIPVLVMWSVRSSSVRPLNAHQPKDKMKHNQLITIMKKQLLHPCCCVMFTADKLPGNNSPNRKWVCLCSQQPWRTSACRQFLFWPGGALDVWRTLQHLQQFLHTYGSLLNVRHNGELTWDNGLVPTHAIQNCDSISSDRKLCLFWQLLFV